MFASFQVFFSVSNSQVRQPAAQANTDVFVKIGTKIGAFKIDDIRSLLQTDFITIMFFAEVSQTP